MTYTNELRKGDAYGFIGPLKPPSADYDKRTEKWHQDFLMATAYLWGRMDAGESRDVNRNYAFGNAWADVCWEYFHQYRTHMPAMYRALELFDKGERI